MNFLFFILSLCVLSFSGCDNSVKEGTVISPSKKETQRIENNKVIGIVRIADGLKIDVANCIGDTGRLDICNAGKNGISADVVNPNKHVAKASTLGGVITITASVSDDLNGEIYTLTPIVTGSNIVWVSSGTICNKISICKK